MSGTHAWQHHIWCNEFHRNRMLIGCKFCDELEAEYPMNGKSEESLMREHFPNSVKVGE